MVNVERRFMIRELYRKGVTISEIARRTGHDRKTIRAALQGPLQPATPHRAPRPKKLDAFMPYLEQRIQDGVVNCNKLCAELCSQGYTGSRRDTRRGRTCADGSHAQPHRQLVCQPGSPRKCWPLPPARRSEMPWIFPG